MKKLKLQKRGMAIMAVMLTAAALVAIPFFFFAGCEQNPKAGLTVPYSINNDTYVFLDFFSYSNRYD